jgi:hypothetical protein
MTTPFTWTPGVDVESAKRRYLARWVHVGCGGAPVAYSGPAADKLGCTGCKALFPGTGPLGAAVAQVKEFRSKLVLNNMILAPTAWYQVQLRHAASSATRSMDV